MEMTAESKERYATLRTAIAAELSNFGLNTEVRHNQDAIVCSMNQRHVFERDVDFAMTEIGIDRSQYVMVEACGKVVVRLIGD